MPDFGPDVSQMRESEIVETLLASPCTIAVVGLSAKTHRASHEVSAYMQAQGFRIIPVNPKHAGTEILGERCHESLPAAAEAARQRGQAIRIVNCFRASPAIPPIVDDAIAIDAEAIWMQLGVMNEEAAEKARAAGLMVVMDRCIKIDHAMRARR
jgi:predicted CoA-binding protein